MRQLHARTVFNVADFPEDTTNLVSQLGGDGYIRPTPDTDAFRKVSAELGVEKREDCGR